MARVTIDEAIFSGTHQCTGNVIEVTDFGAQTGPGVPRPALMEGGAVVRDVECLRTVENWGNRSTEVYRVRVPGAAEDLPAGQVRFSGLSVTVDTKSGKSFWAATGVTAAQAARRGEAA
jgi:hypothetical protein